ncbi:hypothetical protein [Nitrospirillum sp. BR 11828]|uniref:hypothetical protein n=1 Tax=Nitrospirillum sp. BR 11828 TaxID=3104325 RepID=UPI002ACA85B3|nr:hypothetical protein [Nitrospirillum sp. BR 11828]MDZ5650287.1 hypothetical protein [Nitrospirillum sp. BR 11828]
MRRSFTSILAMTTALATLMAPQAGRAARCAPVPGVETFLDPAKTYFVVGDFHGTAEIPAMVADIVCAATAKFHKLVLALEFPVTNTEALKDFSRHPETPATALPFFAPDPTGMADGRSSVAMARMLEQIRTLAGPGITVSFVPFQPVPGPPDPGLYEKAMADGVIAAHQAHPDAKILIFVGRAHARKAPTERSGAVLPMAAHLPAGQTVSLDVTSTGGSAWTCSLADMTCGPKTLGDAPDIPPAGITMTPSAAYDGSLPVGKPFSASPPVPPSASPRSAVGR